MKCELLDHITKLYGRDVNLLLTKCIRLRFRIETCAQTYKEISDATKFSNIAMNFEAIVVHFYFFPFTMYIIILNCTSSGSKIILLNTVLHALVNLSTSNENSED